MASASRSSSGIVSSSKGRPRLSAAEQRKELEEAFKRTDTSEDGRIDATEFKVAMRRLLGTDLALSDCEAIIRSVDTDGNGSIDFDEFCAAIESDTLGRAATSLPRGKVKAA